MSMKRLIIEVEDDCYDALRDASLANRQAIFWQAEGLIRAGLGLPAIDRPIIPEYVEPEGA